MRQPYFVDRCSPAEGQHPTGFAVRQAPTPIDPNFDAIPADAAVIVVLANVGYGGWRRALAEAERICDEHNARWRASQGLPDPDPFPGDNTPDLTDPVVAAYAGGRVRGPGETPLAGYVVPEEFARDVLDGVQGAEPLAPITPERAAELLERIGLPTRALARWTGRAEASLRQMLARQRAMPEPLAIWLAELELWVATHEPPEKVR